MRAIDCGELEKRISSLARLARSDAQKSLLGRVLYIVENMPTLTPPNEPLPILVLDEPDREYIDYICPKCKNTISQRRRGQLMRNVYQCKYHDNCGQRVDWHNPQPYHIPLEGETDEE